VNLSRPFVARPVATTLLMVALLLAGAVAYLGLPVAPLPQVELPTILVQAQQPGASPAIMASSVAAPLERHLAGIADVSEMTSQSFTGITRITLQFGLDRNIDGAARDVQAAINAARAELPTTLRNNPIYRKVNPADAPILVLSLTSTTLTPAALFDVADGVLRQRLSQLSGIGDVEVAGASLPAVRIEANPNVLAALGIGMEDLRAAAASANANSPKGAIEMRGHRLQLSTNDQARGAADFRELVIAWRNGAPVRLADVATVTDSVENLRNTGLTDGKPAILLMLYRQPGANVIAIVDRVRALLPELAGSLPGDAAIAVAIDRSITIRSSLAEMGRSLLLAIGLVVLVVLAFLRDLRAALIPSVAVVVSIVGTFGVMYLLGYSIDNLSLMALIVATGFVVDDAIVVLENTERHMRSGLSRTNAALAGAREVGFTVVSISLSLIAALLPILLMGGIVGRMFREFAVTLSAAILVSLVVSLTVTPMMCAVLLKPGASAAHAPPRWSVFLLAVYARSLGWTFAHRVLVGFGLFATVAVTVVLFQALPKGFFPQQDTGQLVGGIIGDQSASFQLMREKLAAFEQVLREDPAVETVVGFTGGRQTNAASVFVSLKPLAKRGARADAVIARLRPRLAEVAGARLYLRAAQDIRLGGRPGNAQFQYALQGDSEAAVYAAADRLTVALRGEITLVDVNSDQQQHGLAANLAIDRAAAAAHGLTPLQIDNALYDSFGQRQVSTIYDAVNQYHVVLEAAPEFWQHPAMLDQLYVSTGGSAPSGSQLSKAIASTAAGSASRRVSLHQAAPPLAPDAAREATGNAIATVGRSGPSSAAPVSSLREPMVPLAVVARWQAGNAPILISHQGLAATTTISFNLPPGGALADAVATIIEQVDKLGLPASVRGDFVGTAAAFQTSQHSEALLILAAILTVYIVLGVLYESFLHPLTILSTLPSAGAGAMLALLATGEHFTVVALIGVILLIGIVKKNGILLVDFALAAEREAGLEPEAAILEACLKRFRPILMTTIAGVLGAVPLAIGGAEGSELRHPLGIAVIGGLLVSQVLTLYTTPVVYLSLATLGRWALRPSPQRYEIPPHVS
jgi:multidrug efflux pump